MKYTITINQKQAVELGLTNINQIFILDLLSTASTWAKTEIIDEDVYYWVARQVISSELPVLDLKPDTVYRHLRALAENGFIEHIKKGKKDCIRLTEKGKSYYVGNKSEKEANSEINPKKLGNKSEKNSEINPTYPNTNINPTTKDHKPPSEESAPRTSHSFEPVNEPSYLNAHEIFISLTFPEQSLFDEYLSIRKSMRLKNTDRIIDRLLKKYIEFGSNPAVIENAITANWKDFYEVKEYANGKHKQSGRKNAAETMHDTLKEIYQEASEREGSDRAIQPIPSALRA